MNNEIFDYCEFHVSHMLVGYKISISLELEREASCLPHLNFRSTVYWYISFRVHLRPVCYSHLGFYFLSPALSTPSCS